MEGVMGIMFKEHHILVSHVLTKTSATDNECSPPQLFNKIYKFTFINKFI